MLREWRKEKAENRIAWGVPLTKPFLPVPKKVVHPSADRSYLIRYVIVYPKAK